MDKLKTLLDHKFRLIIGLLFLTELLSLFAYLLPTFNAAALVIIVTLAIALAFVGSDYVLLMSVAELLIGSKGYLFSASIFGFNISLRLALWAVVLSVWFIRLIFELYKKKRLPSINLPYQGLWLALLAVVAWGSLNAWISGNSFSNFFFDFNNWLYTLIILPLWSAWKKDANAFRENLFQVFLAASLWLALKTFFLLFAFSHNLQGMIYELYRWVRTSGVGEITRMEGGFYRIFFQSHIYSLFAALIALRYFFVASYRKQRSSFLLYGSLSAVFLSIVLLSFSRSFWFGALAGLVVLAVAVWRSKGFGGLLDMSWKFLTASTFAILLIIMVVKFPFPSATSDFSLSSLADRADLTASEAAISSRWELLSALSPAIKDNVLFGQGLGATVTYQSKDPRVLETNQGGSYTTYAFEWGWLDIWLKFGLAGLIVCLLFIFRPAFDAWKGKSALLESLAACLLALAALNVFTPFINHPLGLGFLAVASIIIWSYRIDKHK